MIEQDGLQLKLTYAMGARMEPPIAARPVLPDLAFLAIALTAVAGLFLVTRVAVRARRQPAAGARLERAPVDQPAFRETDPQPAAAIKPIALQGPGATLQDLHDLQERLTAGTNPISRQQLLEDHLERFAHTSPWVLLELRDVRGSRHLLWAEEERVEFGQRFGVRPPSDGEWDRRGDAILSDPQLCKQLPAFWPLKAKSWIATWMLGSRDGMRPRHGMPVLTLGTYRELLFLDSLLGAREFDHPSEFAPLH